MATDYIAELPEQDALICEAAQQTDGLQDCDHYIDFTSLADLCGQMPDRFLLTGMLVQWLRICFSCADFIMASRLKSRLWAPTLQDSLILIDSVWKFSPSDAERRPAIYVAPDDWVPEVRGIDNRTTFIRSSTATDDPCCDPRSGRYNLPIRGQHHLFCVAGEAGEAEVLAKEVALLMVHFGPIARNYLGLIRFGLAHWGKPAIVQEAKDRFVVPLTLAYGAQIAWQLCWPQQEEAVQAFMASDYTNVVFL